jgi:hypothetical protein
MLPHSLISEKNLMRREIQEFDRICPLKILYFVIPVSSVENCSTAPHAGREMQIPNVLFGCLESAGNREEKLKKILTDSANFFISKIFFLAYSRKHLITF